MIFIATSPMRVVAQPTLAEVWADASNKLTTFVAEGKVSTWTSLKDGERLSAEATFLVERLGDKFYADIKLESLSGAGDLAGLIPERTTILCDGSTIHTMN